MKGISNKVVFVTGGENGLGAAISKRFAEEGAKVVVFGIDEVNGQKVVAELNKITEGALFIKGSVTINADIENAMNIIKEKYGTLDFAVNNAGISGTLHPFLETPIEQFEQIINVNLKGVFQCMQNELKIMSENGFGKIVNISSEAAFSGGFSGFSAYIASKHGVNGLTKAVGVEFAKKGINVNAVAPGTMMTPLVEALPEADQKSLRAIRPSNRLVNVENVANTAVYLCSDYSSDMIGATITIDGGYGAN